VFPATFAVQRSKFRPRRPWVAAAGVAAVVLFVLNLPSNPRPVAGADPVLAARTVRGAFHVHTARSDGVADKASVARAAASAGLQFVVFTDHGDGMRPADAPEYISGVLCLDGVEISSDGGHYIALGAAPSPYPLGGESAAVVEDVARLAGFGIAAHPGSLRPELAWSDWSAPIDGLEWLNADSEWRDESRWMFARSLAAYPLRPPAALAMLLDRPADTLARWDSLSARERVVGLAGIDAHGGIGNRIEDPSRRRSVGVPSYVASFRTFTTRVELDRAWAGDPRADADALLDMLRAGRTYSEIDAIASGAVLEFTARTGDQQVKQGGSLLGADVAEFHARAALVSGASTIAFRNGVEVARAAGTALDFRSVEQGAFRVEIHVAGAPGTPPIPWVVSNPIYRLPPASQVSPPVRVPVLSLRDARWHIEKSDGSEGTVGAADGGGVTFEYRLRGGPPASQFAALAVDLPKNIPQFEAINFTAEAGAPGRLSVQLRFAGDGNARWRKSAYVDQTARPLDVAVAGLRRADGPLERPDVRRASSLLFVVDLTNARPGDAGKVTIREATLSR
jgi:hypothetical protein